MGRLKRFVIGIHRRSLWQMLMIYLGASWAVMEVTDQIVDRYLLPEWVYPAALILLLIGLPVVLATALVREKELDPVAEVRDPTLLGDVSGEAAAPVRAGSPKPVVKLLTWPRAMLAGALAFAALGLVSAVIVLRGAGRVTEAHGAANDAFEERAWIVIAAFEAPEGEADVALAVQTALTLDLQQSEYVNVRGRNQIAPVLARMGVPDMTALDERLALEVAEREGLAAVLAGSVSRLGADYVLGARVVQPGTGEELITVKAAAREDRLLEGVETLAREVRRRLGEERSAVGLSKPLPEVTTGSLEALKRYAEGGAANGQGDPARAAKLAEEAIAVDSGFAMAYRLASVAYGNSGRFNEAVAYAVRAFELRQRLTDRERLHVEGAYYYAVDDYPQALATYETLLSRYPDDRAAHNNFALLATFMGDYDRAYLGYLRAIELQPYDAISYGNALSVARLTDRWNMADSLIASAEAHGLEVGRWRRDQAGSLGEWAEVDAFCAAQLSETARLGQMAADLARCGEFDIVRGRIRRGLERLGRAIDLYARLGAIVPFSLSTYEMVLAEGLRGRKAAARIETVLDRYPADSVRGQDRLILRSMLVLAAELNQLGLTSRLEEAYPASDTATHAYRFIREVIGAATALARDDAPEALARLDELRAPGGVPPAVRYIVNVLSALAFEATAELDSAVAYLEWAAHPAHVESTNVAASHYPAVVRRLAEVEERRGNSDAAVRHYRRFLELWSDADPELQGDVDSARRALARLTGEAGG